MAKERREGFRQMRERLREAKGSSSSSDAAPAHAVHAAEPAAMLGEAVVDERASSTADLSAGLVHSKQMEEHRNGPSHPERPARTAHIVEHLKASGIASRTIHIAPRSVELHELQHVHSPSYIELIRSAYALSQLHGENAEDDEPVVYADAGAGEVAFSKATHSAALIAAGCVCEATNLVTQGAVSTAFAIVRPPGHHACCERAMGFCYFNNVSVAARKALTHPGIHRVLIFDFDVHHGNGVQDKHFEEDDVLYISLHRFQPFFFPGTGSVDEVGSGDGEGYTVNIPWTETGMSDGDYMAAFHLIVDPIAREFAPDLVLISAGFDAGQGDPLGGMALSEAGYMHMVTRIMRHAKQKRCVAALEGGYNLDTIAAAAAATCRALLGQKPKPLSECSPSPHPRPLSMDIIREVAQTHARYWSNLLTPEWEEQYQELMASVSDQGEEVLDAADSLLTERGSLLTSLPDDETASTRSEATNTTGTTALQDILSEATREEEEEEEAEDRASSTHEGDAADEAAEALASLSVQEKTHVEEQQQSASQSATYDGEKTCGLKIRLTKRRDRQREEGRQGEGQHQEPP